MIIAILLTSVDTIYLLSFKLIIKAKYRRLAKLCRVMNLI